MKKVGSRVKTKKCLDKRTVAFALKRRGRPRGKPFAVGNKFGNRFVKGQSGNPGGRPKFTKISEAARAALALDPHDKVEPRTNAEAVAIAAVNQAKRGNIGALTAIADRCEGKPTTSLALEGGCDPIAQLVISMHEVGAKLYGKPERAVKRNKEALPDGTQQHDE